MTAISARKGFSFSSRRANSLTFCPPVGSEERFSLENSGFSRLCGKAMKWH